MGFWIAFQFLTIIPFPFRRQPGLRELGTSLIYFPVIGFLLGGFLFGVDLGLGLVLPSELASALILGLWVLVAGTMHLDGFMDTCDGLHGDTSQRRLEIMADTSVGSFGIVGVIILLLIKYTALLTLPIGLRMEALLLVPLLSRWTMVYAIFVFPYARKDGGLGQTFKQQATWQKLVIATLIVLAVSGGLLRWQGTILMVIAWIIATTLGYFLRSRLGGLTGDTYGAINEIVEVVTLMVVPFIASIGA